MQYIENKRNIQAIHLQEYVYNKRMLVKESNA